MLKWCYLFYLEHLQECPIYLLPIILYWDHCKKFWAQKKMVSSNNCPIFSFQKYATSFHSREDLLSPALMLSDFVRTCKGWFRFAAMSRGASFMHLNCDSCSYPIVLLPRWSKPVNSSPSPYSSFHGLSFSISSLFPGSPSWRLLSCSSSPRCYSVAIFTPSKEAS